MSGRGGPEEREDGPAAVELVSVTRRYRDVVAVADADLDVAGGELLAVLGPSGSGKTTLLRLVVGLDAPTEGTVRIDGESVTGVPPYERRVGMVFERPTLFPHMTVADNVAFGLEMRGTPDAEIEPRVVDALASLGLSELGHRDPSDLSAEQRQRVALARALAIEPSVLLVDEPDVGVAEPRREAMRETLLDLRGELDAPVVYVTSDREEALSVADRVAVMGDGVVHQVGSPEAVYRRPADAFVADYLGGANLLSGTVEAVGPGGYTVDLEVGETVVLSDATGADANVREGKSVTVLFRPELFYLHPRDYGGDADNRFEGVVADATFVGDRVEYDVDVGGERLLVAQQNLEGNDRYGAGDDVVLTFSRGSPFVVPGGEE
ncbi:MAG: ABC transporter ATP-binding protein [Haloferacaceae archaeon]